MKAADLKFTIFSHTAQLEAALSELAALRESFGRAIEQLFDGDPMRLVSLESKVTERGIEVTWRPSGYLRGFIDALKVAT